MTPSVPTTVFQTPEDFLGAVGQKLGTTGWFTVEPEAVSDFARATLAAQPARADPVAPLMILSLTNRFLPELLEVRGISSGINYGTEQVTFAAPAYPGDRLRASAVLRAATEVAGGVQTTVEISVEVEGGSETACVVQSLSRWLK